MCAGRVVGCRVYIVQMKGIISLLGGAVGHFASDNAGPLDGHELAIVELQLGVLDNKRPHLVALSIGV